MEERRKFERFDLRLSAQVKVNSGREVSSEVMDYLTRDVCAGGAYLEGVGNLPEGTSLSLDLVLKLERLKNIENEQALIQVRGKVVRLDEGTGIAVCFEKDYRITPL